MNRQPHIRYLRSTARSKHPRRLQRAVRIAVKLIEQLEDENQSLWLLLDEMRESEIEKHGDVLRERIQDVVDRTQLLLKAKTEEA